MRVPRRWGATGLSAAVLDAGLDAGMWFAPMNAPTFAADWQRGQL